MIPDFLIRPLMYGLLIVSIAGTGFYYGAEHVHREWNDSIAEQATKSVAIANRQVKVTTKVIDHYVTVAGATETVTQYVDREVVRYAQSNPGVCLDPEWRVLHDDAARNQVPGSGGAADGPLRAPEPATGGAGSASSS